MIDLIWILMFAKKIGFGNSDKSMQTWFLKKNRYQKMTAIFQVVLSTAV